VTGAGASEGNPRWTPDGTIVFGSNRAETADVEVVAADGSGRRAIASSPDWESGASWSPDGRRLAFASDRDGDGEIYVASATGAVVRKVTRNHVSDWEPAWSEDGAQIAFVRYGLDFDSVWVTTPQASVPRRVHLDFGGIELVGGQICCPAWAPNGKLALAIGGDDDSFRFGRPGDDVVVGRVGQATWRSIAAGSSPAWSPDGRSVVFRSYRSGDWELYVVPAAGGAPRRLTRMPGFDGGADWSPDGESIVFEHAFRDGTVGLMVMPAQGGSPRVISTADGVASGPSWQPLP
jgi:TolB protein